MVPETNAVVVVTFNRKLLLSECLDALLKQTRPLDSIIIVDNASSDGTGSYLQERGYLHHPSIHYIPLHENLGGAGGFHAGMEAAFKGGFDWVWVMDDDTEPYLDSLEKMEAWKQYPEVVAIANVKVDREGKQTADGLRFFSPKETITTPYTLVRFSSFVGLLIRCSAIKQIGLPRPEFFIHNDDTEYCLRLCTIGNIALASNSLVAHKEIARQQKKKQFLSHTIYQKDIDKFCLDYFGHRNYAWIQQHYRKQWFVRYLLLVSRFTYFAVAVLAFDDDHRWLRLKILAKANLDGIRGRFDNLYPQNLREQLKVK